MLKNLIISFMMQEIKFEPTVMCESVDKWITFRASQVLLSLCLCKGLS